MKFNKLFTFMQNRGGFILIFLSAAFAVKAYIQAVNYPFIYDDLNYIVKNSKLAELGFTELWKLFTEPYNSMSEFLPLRELSYWFDMTMFGMNPSAFRIHNIILYLLCLPFIYASTLATWRYFRPSDAENSPWAAAAVTVLFALHPTFVESVVYISGRKYLLANLFAMVSIWFAVTARSELGLSMPRATAALVAFIAMMLSKSSYVAVALIIAIFWLLFWLDIPKEKRRCILLLWPITILLLATVLLFIFIAGSSTTTTPYLSIESLTRPLSILGWLTRLAVIPENGHFFYPVFEYSHYYRMIALGAISLTLTTVGIGMLINKKSLIGFLLAMFFLLCLPYLQLFTYISPSLVQDRYLALAAWPIAFLLISFLWELKSPLLRATAVLSIALTWNYQITERTRDWSSFEDLVDVDMRAFPGYIMPAMYKSHIQLADGLLVEAEKTAASMSIPEARNIMLKLIKAHQSVLYSSQTGDPKEAMEILQNFTPDLETFPAEARWNTSLMLMWKINRILLRIEWQDLVKKFPNDTVVRNSAKLALLKIWQYDDNKFSLPHRTEQ